MSIVIVGVLVIVWVVALTPMIWRRMSERHVTSGVRSYHRRLLRLGSSSAVAPASVGSSVPGAMIGFSVAAQRLHEERVVQSGGAVSDFPGASYAPAAPVDAERFDRVSAAAAASTGTSPATAARRRQVFTVLGGLTVIFFLVGIIPSARILWDLGLLTLGCTAAYVALLIHFHRLAVERAQKVIALETRRHVTAELESRRHVIVDRTHVAVGGGYSSGYSSLGYADAGSSYVRVTGPALSGSGWSVTGVHSSRP